MKFAVRFAFLLLAFSAFGQKKCDCELKNRFIAERDFQADSLYEQKNLHHEIYRLKQQGSPACRAYAYNLLAAEKTHQGDLTAASLYLEKERKLLDSLRCKPVNYTEYYVVSADFHLRAGAAEKAVQHYNSALLLLKKADNSTLRSRILLSLSNAQSRLKKEDLARSYIRQAHPIVQLLPDGRSKVENLYSLASRYYYQQQVTGQLEFLDSAIKAANFGFSLARRIKYTEGYIKGYNLLENKEYHDHNFRKALVYLDSALYFTHPGVHLAERNSIYADMADIYLELKQYHKAYVFADSALFYANQLKNPYKVRDAMELLYNCSKLDGEYERAMEVYKGLEIMRDSVLKIEIQNSSAFRDMEEKYHRASREKEQYEYEQDQKLFEQQRQIDQMRNKLLVIGIVIAALLAFYIYIVFRQKSSRMRQKMLESGTGRGGVRINPEFIYSALNRLQDDSSLSADKKIALFTKLIKQSIDSSHQDFLTLDKEIQFLTYYLDLQQGRFPEGLSYTFEVQETIDVNDACVPSMVLQPLLENTIERGFTGVKHKAEISIVFSRKGEDLQIVMTDNGNGLKSGATTRASEIINNRLLELNKMNRNSGSFILREVITGGVKIEILLPLITREMADSYSKEL